MSKMFLDSEHIPADLETLVEKPLEELSEEDYHTLQTQLWGGFGHPNNMSAI